MSPYRLGEITVQDDSAGTLVLNGDGYAAAGEISTLLATSGVQGYLTLTESEVHAAEALVSDYRTELSTLYAGGHWKPPSLDPDARPAREALAAGAERVLGPDRMARLQQLSWRVRDGESLADDQLVAALQLTAAQRSAIDEALWRAEDDSQHALESISQTRQMSHEPIEQAGRAAAHAASERLLALLTPEQRQRFELMKRGQP